MMRRWATCCLLLTLVGCTSPQERAELADGIASHAHLTRTTEQAGQFKLASWSRFAGKGEATVYIEGDGLAWLSADIPSPDATPIDPIALRLAAQDTSRNIIAIARPCQYEAGPCDARYWRSARYAPEVIAAYQQLLDRLKIQHQLTGYHLVGFSGGGAVAVLVAAERTDVKSLRTVAGNLDTDKWAELHSITPLHESLNPASVAATLRHLPQRHFVGGLDQMVPIEVYQSYAARMGATSCSNVEMLANLDHENGWVEIWPHLLAESVTCEPLRM